MCEGHFDDAALLAVGRELEAAIDAESALDPKASSSELQRANNRVWQAIAAIGALDARTDAGRLVKAHAAARAYAELASGADEDAADDEKALASLVRAFFPESHPFGKVA